MAVIKLGPRVQPEDKVYLRCHNSLTTSNIIFEIVTDWNQARTDYGSNRTESKGAARGQGLFTLP